MGLYQDVRPTNLDQVVGQPAAVAQLSALLDSGNLPHTILFSGPSGTGKTTLARILTKRLGCDDLSISERNCASENGIDFVRDLQAKLPLKSFSGKPKAYIIDECFPAGTLVRTPNGDVPIESLKEGDTVANLVGWGAVERVWKNKVLPSRVVEVRFDDGTVIECTEDHKFLTDSGWVEAKNLAGTTTLRYIGELVHRSTKHAEEDATEKQQAGLLSVRTGVYVRHKKAKMLLKKVCRDKKSNREGTGHQGNETVPCVREFVSVSNALWSKENMRSDLCRQASGGVPQGTETVKGDNREAKGIPRGFPTNSEGVGGSSSVFGENEEKQPDNNAGSGAENKRNKRVSLRTSFLRDSRRQRTHHTAANVVIRGVGSVGTEPCARASCEHQQSARLPVPLQDRCCNTGENVCVRGRWERPSDEKSYFERRKKDGSFRVVRVESVSYTEQTDRRNAGHNQVLGRDSGGPFLEFYDLQVSGNPSYFVQGVPVHNCHSATPQAQKALLKTFEDTPSHVYFFLCTTNPEKLEKPLINRCTHIKLNSVKIADLVQLISPYVTGPNAMRIAAAAEGSPRRALVMVEQFLAAGEEHLDDILDAGETDKPEYFELVKALYSTMGKADFLRKFAPMLKEMPDEDIEKVRLTIMSYGCTMLLNGRFEAHEIMGCFNQPFFHSKKPGFVLAIAQCLDSTR